MTIRVKTDAKPTINTNARPSTDTATDARTGGGVQVTPGQSNGVRINTGSAPNQVSTGAQQQTVQVESAASPTSGWGAAADPTFDAEAAARAEAEAAAAREAARNLQLHKANDARIAADAIERQRERRKVPQDQAKDSDRSKRGQEQNAARPAEHLTDSRFKRDGRFAVIDGAAMADAAGSQVAQDADAESSLSGRLFGSPNVAENIENEVMSQVYDSVYGDMSVPESLKQRGARTSLLRTLAGEAQRRSAEEEAEYARAEQMARMADRASDVGERQAQLLDRTRVAREAVDASRYRTVDDLRKSVQEVMKGTYTTTPAKGSDRIFEFADDNALRFQKYDADVSDEQIMENVRRAASKVNGEVAQQQRRQSDDTSIERQRNGYIEFDANSTVTDNVSNAERAAASTARIIANPMLISIEGDYVERRNDPDDPRYVDAAPRNLNEEGRDVEGAIGNIRRVFGCSYMTAKSAILWRLGIGVDSNGLICGKTIEDFKLPWALAIEASEDLIKSMDLYGVPNAIVQGRSGGYNRSRDDSGMFPILGGTRCFPLGYMPKFMFDDMSRDPGSPLHGISEADFYRACALTWVNDTQPRILANTDGPLAWQAAALDMAMRGLMDIDGTPYKMFNTPEYKAYRTKAAIQAEIMDAKNEDVQEALEEKNRLMANAVGRWARQNYKNVPDVPDGAYVGPGTEKDRRDGPVDRFFNDSVSVEATARVLHFWLMVTAPLENAFATAQQQVVVSAQNAYKRHLEKKGLGNRFDKTSYLSNAIESKDALEALEVYETLMRIGGRDAVDAFRYDRNDSASGPRYRNATKANMRDFLERWGSNQGSEIKQRIEKAMSSVMFGDGMFKRTKAQQFLDMALYEMAQNDILHGESFTSENLEEMARAGAQTGGAGEALVSSLIDTAAGFEAFKTMGITGLGRTTPWGRATRVVLQKNGVTNFAVRHLIGMFPVYGVNKLTRMLPASNTISYCLAHLIKTGAIKAGEDVDISNKFGEGFKQASDALSRIGNYQVGMDSADFLVGLRKNIAYDVVMFGGNYIMMSMISRAIITFFGGLMPPDDKRKITLPEEWIIRGLGVPVKAAWYMDDLLGCGLPLAYAMEIADGWTEYEDEGEGITTENVIEPNSDRALGVASSAFINMLCDMNQGNFVVDAIDFVTNFQQNLDDIGNWSTRSVEEMRKYYGDDAADMSDSDLRREWILARGEGILWDLFNSFTPPIISELMPGSRDSFWDDGYTHSTSLIYNTDEYDIETAKKDWRTKQLSYQDAQRCRKTQDNVLGAFIADLIDAREGIEYQYRNMPIETVSDPRTRASESFEQQFSLPLELSNGQPNFDLNNDGKTDSRTEKQKYLFDRAEELCSYINDTYILTDKYPEMAVADGFIIPFDARLNAINYCYYMIGSKGRQGKLWRDFYDMLDERGRLEDDEYHAAYNAVQAEVQKYNDILFNYLNNQDIPLRVPRYAHLSTDYNTMYVDSEGNATDAWDPDAREIDYDYGNPTAWDLPFASPRDTGLNDYNSMLWDVMLDEDGNPINDMARIYDQAAAAGDIVRGERKGRNVLQEFTNNGKLKRGDVINFGRRAFEVFEGTYPDILKDPDADTIAKILGIDSYLPGDNLDSVDEDEDEDSSSSRNRYQSGGSYYGYSSRSYPRSYSYSGGGGSSYYSSYNPKIYSSSRQVSSPRASGMSVRQPYKATSTYLRPNFYTKGSREAYKRSDF